MLKAVSDFVARIEAVIAASLAGAVTLLILLNIITRFAGYAIYWVDELAIYCMIWMTFFATSVLLKRRESVAVGLLTEYVKGGTRTVLAKISDLMVLLFGGILAWLSWRWYDPVTLYQVGFDLESFQAETFNFMYAENTSTLGIKKFWVWMVLPILSITLTIHGLANLLCFEAAPEQSGGYDMTAVVFAVLLFLAVPISLVLALTALWYIYDSGNTVLLDSYLQQLFGAIQSYGLLAIPLFMLAGELMNEGGLTSRLVNLARILVGGFRGGMAYINLVANMMMAAIMGSAASQIAMMSRAMVPAMEKDGYEKPYAAAITAAGGLLSPIIPPSMLFVLFGVLAQVPIADMFIAGIIPGLVMSFLFFIAISLLGLKYQYPKGSWPTRQQAKQYFLMGIPAALIPLIIIGGILTGLATPTESAALASMGALVIGKYVYRDLKYKNLFGVLRRTAFNSGMVIMLIAAAGVFGWVIIFEKIPQSAASWIAAQTTDPFMFLMLVVGILLLVGMVIDGIAALILVVPILMPIAEAQFGISAYQFGVVVCLTLVLGLLTPPVGAGLYICSAMTGASPMAIFRALLPFLLATILTLVLISWEEGLVLALL